ncbi:MAG: hypothetical protein ACT4OP_01750 [Actinomycetota bacterium]
MEQFAGRVRLVGDAAPPINVTIDLTDNHHLRIRAHHLEIGEWPLDDVRIQAREDGFHLLAGGDELIIDTDDDPAFAVAAGIRNAPTELRRRMSALMRADPKYHEN